MLRLSASRLLIGTALVLVAALLPGLTTSSANADDSSTLTVVGTSDVWDSNLMETVIIPGFEAWYKKKHGSSITMTYVHTGTGQAITMAEAGTASGLMVHAPSLENSFVGDGYSLEKYGRAVFWGDFVLLGPAGDPAGVLTHTSHEDIVKAFQRIASAGTKNHAEFISRGSNPGTTIAEHAIWAKTSGVPTCTVPDVDGGGAAPSNTPGTCPELSSGTPIDYPSWYHATGLTQALNIEAADTCNFNNPGSNDCYVFTDRGTFDYLESTNALSNMHVMVNDNNLAPADQRNLLVNSFHLYGINPTKFSGSTASGINTSAMTDLLNWLTSPAAQSAVGRYLQSAGNAPFHPDAAPRITASPLPAEVDASKPVTITGSVRNVVPGTPALNGVTVRLQATDHGRTTTLARDTTNTRGRFSVSFVPSSNTASYRLVTPTRIEKVEIPRPTLNPPFGDILGQGSRSLGTTKVTGAVAVSKVKTRGGARFDVIGKVVPRVTGHAGQLQLWAAHPGHRLAEKTHRRLAVGTNRFNETFKLGPGRWVFKLKYSNPGVINSGSSSRQRVSLG